MSLRNLTPIAHAAMEIAQTGLIVTDVGGTPGDTYAGHAGGTSGTTASQNYVELLAGAECGSYIASDSTTGTYYFPEIKFFHSILNAGRDNAGATVASPIQAKTLERDYLLRNTTIGYDPATLSPSNYIFLAFDDTVFGKFSRIAISKPHVSAFDRHKLIITRGV